MTLYRRELVQQSTDGNGVASMWRYVPVEPCEHGKIDGHWVMKRKYGEHPWCPGAGIGGDDE